MGIVNYFFCYEYEEKYYALDIIRIIPMQISKEAYDLLQEMERRGLVYEQLEVYQNHLGYTDIEFLKNCNLLFHEEDQYKVKNSYKELSLSLIPTMGCNLDCKYCYSNVRGNNKVVSLETISQTLTFFCNNYNFNVCRIDFVSGGEPLITPDALKKVIVRIQKILKENNKKSIMWLCTNGTLLNEDILKFLDLNGFYLGVSLDGPKETNDINRVDKKGSGTYDIVQANVTALLNNPRLSRRMKYLWNSVVVSSATKGLVDVVENAYQMGFSNIQMKLVWSNKNEQRLTYSQTLSMYKELSAYLYRMVVENKIDRFLMVCNENDTYGKILLRIIIQSGVTRRCNAGVNKFSVSYDGKLYPCDSFLGNGKYCIGNIYEGFNDMYYQISNMRVESNSTCQNCWARFLCGGDCFYHAYLNSGCIDKPDALVCRITQEIIKMCIPLVISLYRCEPEHMKMIYDILSKRTKSMEPKYEKRD